MDVVYALETVVYNLEKAERVDQRLDADSQRCHHCRDCLHKALFLLGMVQNSPGVNVEFVRLCQTIIEQRRDEKLDFLERSLAMPGKQSQPSNRHAQYDPYSNISAMPQSDLGSMSSLAYESTFNASLIVPSREHRQRVAVFGNASAKKAIQDILLLPKILSKYGHHDIFPRMEHENFSIRRPVRSILLHGAPGTGKTSLVRAAAFDTDTALLPIYPSNIISKWSGDSEKFLRAAFNFAVKNEPCILFFDEIDSMCAHRTSNVGNGGAAAASSVGDGGHRGLLAEFLILLTELLDLATNSHVFVMAATNRLCDLDEAIVRRFERRVVVPLPDKQVRLDMITYYMSTIASCLSDADFDSIVVRSGGWNGSDVLQLCREVAMIPVRELCKHENQQSILGKRREPSNDSDPEPINGKEIERTDPATLSLRDVVIGDLDTVFGCFSPVFHQEQQ